MRAMRLVGGLFVSVVLVGCGSDTSGADLLLVRTPDKLAVVDPETGDVRFDASSAVPSANWSRVIRAYSRDAATHVSAVDPLSRTESWTRRLRGEYAVGAVSADGSLAAFVQPQTTEDGYPAGRASTTIVIDGPGSAAPRPLRLTGNYAPEAFSLDRASLFVIEYLPPLEPDRYRVRRLDLASGRTSGVHSVDGHLQEAMRGTARTQALAPDGRRLYTMYWLADGSAGGRAFVHVLDLDEQWAHCIDLPPSVGSRAEEANALSLSADGKRLYVADGDRGALAEIDTNELNVVRTTPIDLRGTGPLRIAAGPGERLYLARDDRLAAFEDAKLEARDRWIVPGRVSGIQPATDDRRLFLALDNRVIIVDRTTGRNLRTLTIDGLKGIDQLGLTGEQLDSVRSQITCAC